MQQDKNYIFHAKNPVTDLNCMVTWVIIAYNKKLVLECNDWGLDFTLSMPHMTVPIVGFNCGLCNYSL